MVGEGRGLRVPVTNTPLRTGSTIFCSVAVGLGSSGESLLVVNASRHVGELYECVASNGVPPAVSRQMRVSVQCTCIAAVLSARQLCGSRDLSLCSSGL